MPRLSFEPTIAESKRAKTVHALDHSATVTGYSSNYINTVLSVIKNISHKVTRSQTRLLIFNPYQSTQRFLMYYHVSEGSVLWNLTKTSPVVGYSLNYTNRIRLKKIPNTVTHMLFQSTSILLRKCPFVMPSCIKIEKALRLSVRSSSMQLRITGRVCPPSGKLRHWTAAQWMRLALSNGPNTVGDTHSSLKDGNRSIFWNVVFFCIF
jgi:hypothetical protein